MTRRASTEEYYEDAKRQAKLLFDELHPRRAHGVDWTIDTDELRERLNLLDDAIILKGTLADLLVGIPQKEGIARRKIQPPPSPFKKEAGKGNAWRATKGEIIKWDLAWRLKGAVSELAQSFLKSGSTTVVDHGRILTKKLQWLVANGDVLGWIDDLQVTAFEQAAIEDLSIKSWTVPQALHQPWHDPDEQGLWVKRYEAGNRLLEAEIRRLALAAQMKAIRP